MSQAIRVVSTLVFPEPAPARTKMEEVEWVVASICGWFSPCSISDIQWALVGLNFIGEIALGVHSLQVSRL